MTTRYDWRVASVVLAPKKQDYWLRSLKNRVFLALTWAFLFVLWPGQLWLRLPLVSGYLFCRAKRHCLMPPTKSKDIILGSNCRRGETRGVCADCATGFYGSKAILQFLLLAQGSPSFHVLVSWEFFLPHWERTLLAVLFLSLESCRELVVGSGGACCPELIVLAWESDRPESSNKSHARSCACSLLENGDNENMN